MFSISLRRYIPFGADLAISRVFNYIWCVRAHSKLGRARSTAICFTTGSIYWCVDLPQKRAETANSNTKILDTQEKRCAKYICGNTWYIFVEANFIIQPTAGPSLKVVDNMFLLVSKFLYSLFFLMLSRDRYRLNASFPTMLLVYPRTGCGWQEVAHHFFFNKRRRWRNWLIWRSAINHNDGESQRWLRAALCSRQQY